MDIQSSALNTLFALFPVIVQGWVTPVRPVNTADGGIPKSLYDDQPKGLECLVDPWVERFNQAVAVDDRVDLFINNGVTPVDGKTIGPGEENLRVRLYVPKGRLRDGVNQIYYRVTRASGNGSEESRKLSVLYHLWAPGEPAPEAIRLLIPDEVSAGGVGPEQAARGVDFGLDYDNRRPYDLISLTLGTRGQVERELTPQEGESGEPLIQTLFADTFTKNPDNARTPIFYSVTDQLGNFSRSATSYIDVHVNRVLLTPPDLSEDPDDPNDDPDTIDLGKVKDFLYVLVHVFSPLWVAGDVVRVSYSCTPANGAVVTHTAEATVGRLPFTHKLPVPVAKVLPDSKVAAVYELVRAGKVVGTSGAAKAQVIGKPVVDEKPTITSVTDSEGKDVLNGGDTGDETVNLTGTANSGEEVEIFDGATTKGKARAIDGTWKHTVTGLTFGTVSLTAKALYGSGQVSEPAWTFTRFIVEGFDSIPTTSIPLGGRISTPFFDIFYAQGQPSIQVQIASATGAEGLISGQTLQPSFGREGPYSVPVKIELQLRMPCSRVTFWSGVVSAPASVEFNNADGARLGTRTIPHIAIGSILHMTDFSAAGISKITLVTTGNDWCNIDTFTFWP